ncbi:MAG: leucine-rich repeat protein [Clostridia bacterium]|nr:leucine-rich repeat protein [Clostridia bacterium]
MKRILKKTFAIVICLALLLGMAPLSSLTDIFSVKASAAVVEAGQCGENVYYSLDTNGTLTISGTGDMYEYGLNSSNPFYRNNRNIKSVIIEDGVTSIPTDSFFGCIRLTSITIPDSVTSIGSGAFYECTELTSIEIPDGVTSIGIGTFQHCSGLTSVIIPSSVIKIDDNAFSGCTGLTSVTIPNSVTRIGVFAFYNCTGLTSIEIPGSVTSIGNDAFSGCTGLTSVTIPSSVKHIGEEVFSECTGLTSIEIPDSVKSIGFNAFSHCNGLTNVTIPGSVTSIINGAFRYCTGLTSVTIMSSMTSIESDAFEYCTGLTIRGFRNSTAQVYAQQYNIPFEFLGDYAYLDLIKTAGATSSIEGTTITLTADEGATMVSFYPTLIDGSTVTFSNLTGGAKTSKSGTLYSKADGSATATINGTEYTIVFDFEEALTLEENIKFANATASLDGTTITLTADDGATTVSFYPTLKDGTAVTFSGKTGGAAVSKSGTLYAKSNGTAVATIGGTDYTIVFDFGAEEIALEDNIKFANATAVVNGNTITLTADEGATTISFYPTLKDGSTVTFSNLTGGAKTSKSGTLYSKTDGSATATINGTEYTVIFDFDEAVPIEDNIKFANAAATVSGTTITLTAIDTSKQISFYPTLKDGSAVAISNLTGGAKVSKSGTLYSKSAGTATATIDGTDYTVVFVF